MPEDTTTPKFENVKVGQTAPAKGPRGRGRPPGSPNKPKNATDPVTNAEVDQAIQVLESMYDFLGMGLVMGQLPATAGHLADQRDDLRNSNEKALRASPKLCRSIARVGTTGGTGVFLMTNAMLAFGLWNVANREIDAKRAAKEQEARAQYE